MCTNPRRSGFANIRVLMVVATMGTSAAVHAQWLQWGGPDRSFTSTAEDLADRWPETGPKQIWRRNLGGGHSTILVDDGRLFTMFRRGTQDVVICVAADSGDTIWETAYDAPMKPGMQLEFGEGPNSTPMIVGDRLFTVGATVLFHCFDKNTGKVIWSKDLMTEMQASHVGRGFSCSPIAYRDLVILNIGSPETGLAAFRQDTGEVAWKSAPHRPSHSSPILANIAGEDHLISGFSRDRFGVDPQNGEQRWLYESTEQQAAIISTPLFIAPDKVFFTCAYGGGTQLLHITKVENRYEAKELWHSSKLKVQHANIVRVGDIVYGSSGDFGPAFLMAVQLSDGKVLWRDRTFAKATLAFGDGKLIILDESGRLGLAAPNGEGLNLVSETKVLQERAWSTPTLIGSRLFLRDYHSILALDLGKAANG